MAKATKKAEGQQDPLFDEEKSLKENSADSALNDGNQTEKTIDHEVTQQDLDDNPDLVANMVPVGDIIQIPVIGPNLVSNTVGKFMMPILSDDDITAMASNPDSVDIAKRVLAEAKRLHAEANKPVPKSEEEIAADAYARLVRIYGADFVTAKRGNDKKYFSRVTWNTLPKGKVGWIEQTKKMPELNK